MLLIDGVRYEEWKPEGPQAEDEFEKLFKEHSQEIFGEESLYFDIKQRLETELGIRTIPDGFVVSYGEPPQWRVIEAELSWHPLYDHIVNQIGRFISGIENTMNQRKIINVMDRELVNNDFLRMKLKKAIGATEVYRFLSDLISQKPILTIIIEKDTDELREALNTLRYPQIKVVEFQTYIREGISLAVHAHLFEPLYQAPPKKTIITEATKEEIITTHEVEGRVTIKDLLDAGIIKVGQVIYRLYKSQRFEGKVLNDGSIELAHTGEKCDSLSGAAKDIAGSVDGWTWWHTTRENGTECLLNELRKEYKSNPSH